MIEIKDKKLCSGCAACYSICPHDAIVMEPDGMGFLYPIVNTELCVDCGLCDRVCSFNSDYDISENLITPDVYAARHKDESELLKSQSGGMFVALSDWILENGGVVYGVGYEDYFRVIHKRAATKGERDEFRGSKYVQSDINNSFSLVKKDLINGSKVMFTGSPCQIAGLKSYLNILNVDVSNLYACDIICNGVPSPYIWKDYLSYIEKKFNKKITKVNFRDKSKTGWNGCVESFCFNEDIIYTDNYKYIFCRDIIKRQCCGVCPFSNFKRPSDTTIADYWGSDKYIPDFYPDDKGISLLLINTKKGQDLFKAIKSNVHYLQTDTDRCVQRNLHKPPRINRKSQQFESDYVKYGFNYVSKKYAMFGWRNKFQKFKNNLIMQVKKTLNIG